MYRLRYFSDFKSINNDSYCVAIYINTDDAISAEELTLSADAVSIEYSSDDIFQPLKQSGCTINILTPSVLTDLHTAELNNVYVKILKNGNLFWFGFLTPNLYSSEYTSDYNLLSLNCIDVISQLENIKYTSSTNSIKSFYDVIVEALAKIDPTHIINNIYMHKVLSLDNSYDMLKSLYIQERNFFDEESEPQTYKSVLEDILRYLDMTLIQFNDSYYIIEYSSLKANSNFIKYDISASSVSEVSITPDYRTLQNIGITQSNGTISLGDVYNKIKIVANINPMDSVIPDIMGDWENQNEDESKYYEVTKKINDTDYNLLSGYFNNTNEKITVSEPRSSKNVTFNEITGDNIETVHQGIVLQKVDEYKISDGEPSSLSWKSYASMLLNGARLSGNDVYLSLKNNFMGKNGYLILNINYKLSTSNRANDIIDSDISDNNYKTEDKDKLTVHERDKWTDDLFPVTLTIGSGDDILYYAGDGIWEDIEVYNKRYDGGYYKRGAITSRTEGTYYGVWREEWNRYQFVTKAEYDQSTAKKITGTSDLYVGSSDGNIFVTDLYAMEIDYKHSFFCRHVNKEDNTIYGVSRKLNNTVSFRYNIVNSEDGVAIKLPTGKALFGILQMTVYAPNVLGTLINYNSDTFDHRCSGIHISDISLKYSATAQTTDIYNLNAVDDDILYENVIDSSNITEMDDLEMRVNTYSPKAGSYSYVLKKSGEIYDFVDNISKGDKADISESLIIDKYYNHYKSPKFIYNDNLNNKNIRPYTIVHMTSLNRDMIVDGIIYNLSSESAEVTLKEV